MRAGGSKEKGSSFEREIAVELSRWITKGTRTDLFRRTVLSGGQFTQGKSLRGEPGDLGPNHELGFPFVNKFVIECKTWADLSFHNFLWKKGELYYALEKVQKEARDANKSWMLIAKQNKQHTLVFIPVSAILHLSTVKDLDCQLLFNGTVYMTRFYEMVKLAKPEHLVQEYRVEIKLRPIRD